MPIDDKKPKFCEGCPFREGFPNIPIEKADVRVRFSEVGNQIAESVISLVVVRDDGVNSCASITDYSNGFLEILSESRKKWAVQTLTEQALNAIADCKGATNNQCPVRNVLDDENVGRVLGING